MNDNSGCGVVGFFCGILILSLFVGVCMMVISILFADPNLGATGIEIAVASIFVLGWVVGISSSIEERKARARPTHVSHPSSVLGRSWEGRDIRSSAPESHDRVQKEAEYQKQENERIALRNELDNVPSSSFSWISLEGTSHFRHQQEKERIQSNLDYIDQRNAEIKAKQEATSKYWADKKHH